MTSQTEDIKQRLISAGGRMAQDLGLGRIAGQIVVYIYLSPDEKSLDDIGAQLGLSKASVSIAIRQLERLGMVVRVWKTGDRKNYYQTASNFSKALQKGILEFVNQKVQIVSEEIDSAHALLSKIDQDSHGNQDFRFLQKRLNRAQYLKDKILSVIDNSIVRKLLH